jgi:hypothetical protein
MTDAEFWQGISDGLVELMADVQADSPFIDRTKADALTVVWRMAQTNLADTTAAPVRPIVDQVWACKTDGTHWRVGGVGTETVRLYRWYLSGPAIFVTGLRTLTADFELVYTLDAPLGQS